MKKLELKHLSCYLPYGLKMFYTSLDGREPRQWTLRDGTFTEAIVNQNKPILRPLSDLAKEIEVDGKKFVPALILWQVSAKEEEEFEIYGTIPEYWKHCMHLNFENDLDYRSMKLLFGWHFDCFELLENNLAVNYNDIYK